MDSKTSVPRRRPALSVQLNIASAYRSLRTAIGVHRIIRVRFGGCAGLVRPARRRARPSRRLRSGRRAASLSHHLALRHPSRLERLPGALSARFPAAQRVGISVSRRRHHRRLAAAAKAGTGRRRTTTSCRKSCARRARARRSIYVPGNHDEAARQFCDLAFGDIHVRGEAFHTTLAGKRLWIVHGDLFDGVIQHAKWLAYLGDTALHDDPVPQPLVQPRAQRSSASVTGRCRST